MTSTLATTISSQAVRTDSHGCLWVFLKANMELLGSVDRNFGGEWLVLRPQATKRAVH